MCFLTLERASKDQLKERFGDSRKAVPHTELEDEKIPGVASICTSPRCTTSSTCMSRSDMNIAMCTISITGTTMHQPMRPESRIATGTGTRGFGISICITPTGITVMSMNTRERVNGPSPEGQND